jgi:glutamate synthase (NADPH/NADH) large chain
MGIHELRGYGRIFASIGLSTPLVEVLDTPNYGGSAERGLTWADLDKDVETRRQLYHAEEAKLPRLEHFYPLVGKTLRELARGEIPASEAFAHLRAQERQRPVTLRHVLGSTRRWPTRCAASPRRTWMPASPGTTCPL